MLPALHALEFARKSIKEINGLTKIQPETYTNLDQHHRNSCQKLYANNNTNN